MLRVKSTMNYAGITVSGNPDDFTELYDALSSVIRDECEYFYNAAAHQRVSDTCSKIRHTYQEKPRPFLEINGHPCCALRILWPEAAFVAAVLDNFVLLAEAKKLYVNRLPHELKNDIPTVSSAHIALIHYFQDLVWSELEHIVGEWQVREIFGEYNELRKLHFKFPQLDGYCTQWLDLLNTQYLFSAPETRKVCLVTTLKKLFSVSEEYLALKSAIEGFAEQDGVRVTGFRFADCFYLNNIEW